MKVEHHWNLKSWALAISPGKKNSTKEPLSPLPTYAQPFPWGESLILKRALGQQWPMWFLPVLTSLELQVYPSVMSPPEKTIKAQGTVSKGVPMHLMQMPLVSCPCPLSWSPIACHTLNLVEPEPESCFPRDFFHFFHCDTEEPVCFLWKLKTGSESFGLVWKSSWNPQNLYSPLVLTFDHYKCPCGFSAWFLIYQSPVIPYFVANNCLLNFRNSMRKFKFYITLEYLSKP